MARLFFRLKLRLMAGALRGAGSGARITGLVVAIVAALAVMPAGFLMLASVRGTPAAAAVVATAFTIFMLGWLVLPVMLFGSDETLDPARLALLPLRPAKLAAGLMAAALTGIGPVVTLVILLGGVVALVRGPVSVVVGVLGVLIELGLCVAGSRALITGLSGMLRSRRGRDLGFLLAGLVSLSGFAANLALQRSLSGGGLPGRSVLAAGGPVARWSPPGMTAHAIADAAAGRYGLAGAELAVGAVTVALLIWAWIAALGRALVRPDASTQVSGRRRSRAGVAAGAGVVAGVVAGAAIAGRIRARPWDRSRSLVVAGRELRYYWRDPRRRQQLFSLIVPVFWILLVSRARIGGAGPATTVPAWPAVLGGVMAGLFSGANQFGFDGAAFWLTISTTARWQDLRTQIAGKTLAGVTITIPIFAVLYCGLGLATGNLTGAAVAFGMAVCALGVTSAVATVTSVLVPAPIPERRSSVFGGGGAGQGCLAGLAMLAGVAVSMAVMVPLFVIEATGHGGLWLLVGGPAYGAALAWVGRLMAAKIGYRRMPEILAVVSAKL